MNCIGFDPASGQHLAISWQDGLISLTDALAVPPSDADWVSAGWIDLQVNGYAAVDYNSPSTPLEEIARSASVLHSTGTTRFYPTVITNSPENMQGCIENLHRARAYVPSIEGIHVEGPHICPDEGPRGAHPERWVCPPSIDQYRRWQDAAEGDVRLVTLSPEWPGATRYIETVAGEGVVVSIGHTKATSEQIADAVAAGATMSTHIGNGAHSVLARHPNYLWDQLANDRLTAGLIADGIHIGSNFLKVAIRAKTPSRCVLVTDASMPALAEPGPYQLGEVEVELTVDGRVVLRGGTRLAGSSLRMDDAIGNVVRMAGVPLVEAISMATRNAARAGRISGRQRGLTPGDRADLVLFRWDAEQARLRVVQTIVGGASVFSA
jgi:N-acetylglucosamine-6-phosphate deacetylase